MDFKTSFSAENRLYNKQLDDGSLFDVGIYPVYGSEQPEQTGSKAAIAIMGSTRIDENSDVVFHYPNNVKAELESSIIKKTPTTAVFQLEKAEIKLNH